MLVSGLICVDNYKRHTTNPRNLYTSKISTHKVNDVTPILDVNTFDRSSAEALRKCTTIMYGYSGAPLKPVKKVQLGIISPEEIVSDTIH